MNETQSTVDPPGTDAGSKPLLALKGFTKSFGPVEALKDVDLDSTAVRSSAWSATTAPASRR